MAIRIFLKSKSKTFTSVEYVDTDTGNANSVDIPYDLSTTTSLDGPQLSAWMDRVVCDAVNQDNSTPGKATSVDIIR